MSQVITNAFEQYWQSSLAAEQPVVLDEFVLADIPNLDITSPIDPDTGLPPAGQIVYRQDVDQRGRVNNNAVAYSIVMDTAIGDFSFNAMYLRNKANGVVGMIVYKGRETKLKTDQPTAQTGNSLVKSMLMGYDQAAEATLTQVDAGTWQIDYAARLRGQDEDLRQLASQLYGHHTFIGNGFKVVEQAGAYQVTQGVAVVGGLRIELQQPEVIYPGSKPIGVWVDVYRSGSLLSEHQNHFTLITSVADLTDHVDGNGYQHYVAKLAMIAADSTAEDGRGNVGSGGTSISDALARLEQADAMLGITSWEALRRTYAEAGYNLVPGSFKKGATANTITDVVLDETTGKAFLRTGTLPITVLEKSSPDAGWSDASGKLLALTLPFNSPETFNAKGDGVADDSAAVNNAIYQPASSLHLRNGGKYLVPSLSNPLGRQAVGKGQLLKIAVGGLEMQNSYVDAYQRMTGQENLARWFHVMMQPAAAPRIVFSGDSTTAGDGTSTDFKIHLLVKRGLRGRGLQTNYGINAINKGHSGDTAAQWAATYVTQDIADNPDLYVVRWGINDVKDINTFATNLRAGLTTYRNAKPFAVSSILLMMPNSTYDIPNGRDAKWYEQLRDVYVQAAREFKCAFIDTYAITQNSKGLAGLLMDDPYNDGRGIHPNDLLNSIIAGHIIETIAPTGAATAYGSNNVMTTAGGESATTPASFLPVQYDGAISFIRTLPANGWPLDGNAITFKTPDGSVIQYHFGYLEADRGKMFIRFGRSGTLAGQPDGWSDFLPMGVRVPSVSMVSVSGYQAGSAKCNKTGTVVIIDGKMIRNAEGTVTIGETIGYVPAGFRPTRDPMYGAAIMINDAGSSFVSVPINVATDGQLSVAGTVPNVKYIYLNISYDITP